MYRSASLKLVPVVFASLLAAACGHSGGDAPTADTSKPATTTAPTAAPTHTSSPTPTATHAATAAATAAATGGSAAEAYRWETHKPSGMKFEVPSNWTTGARGDVLVTKTAGVGIEFVGVTSAAAGKADEKAMLIEVGKLLQNAKVTSKLKPVEQHGSKGYVFTGTGKKDGADVEWFSVILGGKTGAILALGMYAPSVAPAVKAQMVHVLDSIQQG